MHPILPIEIDEAAALAHLNNAETQAQIPQNVEPNTSARNIAKVAVIGSGTMGGGIAMNFLNAGIPTSILDLNADALERGIGIIRRNYEISLSKGRISPEELEQRMALLTPTTDYADLADADLVIEAVFEDMAIKKKVFQTLDTVCKAGAILASNTSTLDVDEIATTTQRPGDVIGLHFFSPANVMRLLEIVRSKHTADDTLVTALNVAAKIGKTAVVSGVCWGFIGNRMIEPFGRESTRLILEGASAVDIDRVHRQLGMAMGFTSVMDLAGLDVSYLTRQGRREFCYDIDPAYTAISDKLYELGRYGQKNGRGFYIYDGRDKQPDPEVNQLASELAAQYGIERREISDEEILQRTLFPLINEGARILEEGIAARASDIDVVYCNGYGFPKSLGGPMYLADQIGLNTIVNTLKHYESSLGDYGKLWFSPSPLLTRLAAENRSFADFDAATN